MVTKVGANGLGISHKGSDGFSKATLPDVCKTPSPGGPVPMPYPNFATSSSLSNGTTSVKLDGSNMAAHKPSEYAMSQGDEPGTLGGVTSNTFKKQTNWITFSLDVYFEGEPVCRLTDKKFHNNKNTVDAQGDCENPLPAEDFEDILSRCAKEAEETVNTRNNKLMPLTNTRCEKRIVFRDEEMTTGMALGILKGEEAEKCVQQKMSEEGRRGEVSTQQPYKGSAKKGTLTTDGPARPIVSPAGSQVPDVVVHEAGTPTAVRAIYDFKFPCPPNSNDYHWFTQRGKPTQGERYFSMFGKRPHIVTPGRGVSLPPLRNPAF